LGCLTGCHGYSIELLLWRHDLINIEGLGVVKHLGPREGKLLIRSQLHVGLGLQVSRVSRRVCLYQILLEMLAFIVVIGDDTCIFLAGLKSSTTLFERGTGLLHLRDILIGQKLIHNGFCIVFLGVEGLLFYVG
jgi:hypothetical protein